MSPWHLLRTLLLLSCVLLLGVPAAALEPDDRMLHDGEARIEGSLEYLEDGDLCIAADRVRADRPLDALQGTRICLSNQDAAMRAVAARRRLPRVDVVEVCGFSMRASILVSEIWTGEGPARTWYAARLLRIRSLGPVTTVPCTTALPSSQ